ncbi:sel1 repeat family protein, partial [Streptomyces sp. NEAU-H3]|nr:sel1 repeat family protein [Streptomyces sp. NEAU-H3]
MDVVGDRATWWESGRFTPSGTPWAEEAESGTALIPPPGIAQPGPGTAPAVPRPVATGTDTLFAATAPAEPAAGFTGAADL